MFCGWGTTWWPIYFAQDQYKVLDPAARMLEDISGIAPRVPETELRSLLGCFLFSGDDVFKPLGVLSGGERNRYALARILVSPANFLLLDEPTNHLDLRAKDVLLDAVNKFIGTVIFVSHDRYFIDRLATRVFEVEGGHVHVFPGNYEDYLWRKQGGDAIVVPAAVVAVEVPASAAIQTEEKEKVRRLNPIRLRQMQERLAFVEEEIPRVEASIANTEHSLGVYVSVEETERLTRLLDSFAGAAGPADGRMGRPDAAARRAAGRQLGSVHRSGAKRVCLEGQSSCIIEVCRSFGNRKAGRSAWRSWKLVQAIERDSPAARCPLIGHAVGRSAARTGRRCPLRKSGRAASVCHPPP